MKAEIIVIGDEILNGSTLDTNSHFLSQKLDELNIDVHHRVVIQDRKEDILSALRQAFDRSQLVLTTGGLGPTKDDITKKTICEFFDDSLIPHQPTLDHIVQWFGKRGREVLQVNRDQALVPSSALVIVNELGTAPGIWMEANGTICVTMPGVPYEMKHIVETGVIPRLRDRLNQKKLSHYFIHTVGVGESSIANQISAYEDALPEHIRLAYLPSPGIVKLRLTGQGENIDSLNDELKTAAAPIEKELEQIIFGRANDSLSSVIGKMLNERGESLGTVESCSSGYLAQMITQSPGSSHYYMGSLVTYSYGLKEKLLGVKHETLTEHGAVSEETIREMAYGGLQALETDYVLATSGIAGPGGGLPNKPVGTVWIAVANSERIETRLFHFGSDRKRNIHLTAVMALDMLRRFMLGYPISSAK